MDKRLNKKWTPKPITGQHDFLDLDYVADINKTIQLWVGYISKQLIDNKIVIAEAPGYIERTLIGTVKLWLQNLTSESLTTLRNNKKFDGGIATTTMEILYSLCPILCGNISFLVSPKKNVTFPYMESI